MVIVVIIAVLNIIRINDDGENYNCPYSQNCST